MKTIFNKTTAILFGILNVFVLQKSFAQTRTDQSVVLEVGNVIYETPKAYELMHIAIALTDTTIVSNGYNVHKEIINKNGNYYKEVMQHFAAYSNHKLIQELNKKLRKSATNVIYNTQKGNNLNFKNGQLEKIKIMPWIFRTYINLKAINKKTIEDFARVSNFESFYAQHQAYYTNELKMVQACSDVNNQQKWLETEFPSKYNNYRIIVSPLMGSTHFTKRFKFKGNRKCIMWVSSYNGNQDEIKESEKAFYTGIVMTEIDHNYVNPVSKKYKSELKKIMGGANRSKWTNGGASNHYASGYAVFNEYMTHAVYLLYIQQHFEAKILQSTEKTKIEGMIKRRKFIKFAEFYEQLKQLNQNRQTNETLTDLYPKMLEWCRAENIK